MGLRIFVSSTYTDFAAERAALERAIQNLASVFVGMEHFGSDPRRPADMCAALVRSCDLFVCFVGDSYGSVDPQTSLSFTETEYLTAADRLLPCALYFPAP